MKRFLFSNNGTLVDYSSKLEDYHADSAGIPYVKDEDVIYIGSRLPFNSLYFDVSELNLIGSVFTMELWDGNSWEAIAELDDQTSGLTKNGYITWVPRKDKHWVIDDTVKTNDAEEVTGLGDVVIYDLYWLRLTMSETITPTTAINWIGSKFCSDADLESEYTLFENSTFKANYAANKTDWEREIILASRLLIDDIEKKGAITSGDQLLIRRKLLDACVSKTAQIIFKNLGDDYKDDAARAKNEYYERLNKNNYGADLNNNATTDPSELKAVQGVLFK